MANILSEEEAEAWRATPENAQRFLRGLEGFHLEPECMDTLSRDASFMDVYQQLRDQQALRLFAVEYEDRARQYHDQQVELGPATVSAGEVYVSLLEELEPIDEWLRTSKNYSELCAWLQNHSDAVIAQIWTVDDLSAADRDPDRWGKLDRVETYSPLLRTLTDAWPGISRELERRLSEGCTGD